MKKNISKESRFLKGFSKIKVGSICKEYGLDTPNIQNGRSKKENENKVMKRLIKEILLLIIKIYLEDEEDV